MSLADRIVVMNEGVLQQVGTPTEVYLHPANLFVAQFVGRPVMNIADATVAEDGGAASVAVGERRRLRVPARAAVGMLNGQAGGELALGIRPEGVLVSREAAAGLSCRSRRTSSSRSAPSTSSTSRSASRLLRARTTSGFVGRAGDRVLARHRPGAGAFLRHRKRAHRSASGWETDMARIRLENVTKTFGSHTAVDDLDLDIADGEFFVLLGPTGAGKTTTLRLIAGLEKPTDGHVFIDGVDVTDWGAGRARRGAGAAAIFALSALHRAREPRLPAEARRSASCPRPRSTSASTAPPRRCASSTCSTARPTGCRAARCSASRSAAPSCASRGCS